MRTIEQISEAFDRGLPLTGDEMDAVTMWEAEWIKANFGRDIVGQEMEAQHHIEEYELEYGIHPEDDDPDIAAIAAGPYGHVV